MKRWLLLIMITCLTNIMFGQNNPRPSKSRFWLSKQATFQVKEGDILVYEVIKGEERSKFFITITDTKDGMTFNYSSNEKDVQGTVHLTAESLISGNAYQNLFVNTQGLTNKTNTKGMLWLSQTNYRQLAAKNSATAKMDMGNGLETFIKSGGSVQKIMYKGQERILTVHKIISANPSSKKEYSVLTDIVNPLIVHSFGEVSFNLKEVR